ncbi:MAG: restriction endonuclease [Cyanobacteria bacterium P01_H01_bin.58]
MVKTDWEDYERKVQSFLRGKMMLWFPHLKTGSIIVHGKKVYSGAKGDYEIDASAELLVEAMKLIFLVECKHWSSPVSQDTVLAFESKLRDVGAHKGIIVSKSGFQKGAKKVATAHGIALWQYDPRRRPAFKSIVLSGDWEYAAREFEKKWLRRLRGTDFPAHDFVCYDNVYPWGQSALTLMRRLQMLLLSWRPLWRLALALTAFREYWERRNNSST